MVRLTLSAHAGYHLGPQWSPQCGGLSSLCLWEFLQSLWQLWTPHNFHSRGPHSICQQGPQRPVPQKILEAVATEVTNSHIHCRVTREADAVVLWPRKSCYCVARGPGIQHPPTLDTPFTPELQGLHVGSHLRSTLQDHSMGTCFSGLSSEVAVHTPTLWTQHSGCSIYTAGTRTNITVVVWVPWAPELLSPPCTPVCHCGSLACACVSFISAAMDWPVPQILEPLQLCEHLDFKPGFTAAPQASAYQIPVPSAPQECPQAPSQELLGHTLHGRKRDEVIPYLLHLSWRVPETFTNTDLSWWS